MDLGAYSQIDDLSSIMYANGIEVPRLRGLRLMKDETPFTMKELKDSVDSYALYICKAMCENNFRELNPSRGVISRKTARRVRKYLYQDGYVLTGVKWHAIHGKKRKMFRYAFKQARKRILGSANKFNSYCGRDDVLYIHARIGGGNWYYFGGEEIEKQPWFIEKVDDYFDKTYCDIYARIDPEVNYGQSENS